MIAAWERIPTSIKAAIRALAQSLKARVGAKALLCVGPKLAEVLPDKSMSSGHWLLLPYHYFVPSYARRRSVIESESRK